MKGGEGVSTSLPPLFFVSIGVVGSCLCVSLFLLGLLGSSRLIMGGGGPACGGGSCVWGGGVCQLLCTQGGVLLSGVALCPGGS